MEMSNRDKHMLFLHKDMQPVGVNPLDCLSYPESALVQTLSGWAVKGWYCGITFAAGRRLSIQPWRCSSRALACAQKASDANLEGPRLKISSGSLSSFTQWLAKVNAVPARRTFYWVIAIPKSDDEYELKCTKCNKSVPIARRNQFLSARCPYGPGLEDVLPRKGGEPSRGGAVCYLS